MPRKFGLTKNNILDKKEIQQAFNNLEKKFHTVHFTFLFAKRSIKTPGLCVILAKRNIKKATKRNLCRRLVKESFRLHKGFLEYTSLIVLGKKEAEQSTKEELWQSIRKFEKFLQGF